MADTTIGNVAFLHPLYKKHQNQVKIVTDIYNGSDSASSYLSQFPQEIEDTFVDRKNKIALKNYVKRATEAFVGMIFRKPIDAIGYSENMMKITKRIDTKSTINQFARRITEKLIRDGKTYILVDSLQDGSNPYLISMDRNSVINWSKDENGNFTLIVIREFIEDRISEFEVDTIEQYRVYRDDGNITIYRQSEQEFYEYSYIETDLDYIPVQELSLDDIPPLYDIARLNIKHMNRTSAKDRYLDMAACPVPVIWGAEIDDEGSVSSAKPALVIGVDEAFIFNGTKDECDFQWRELSGSSIDQLQNDLSVIEEDITSGVIRASSSENTTMKTATQSYYEASEASNRVTVIANIVEYALNASLDIMIDMLGENDSVGGVIINKDYNAIAGSTTDLRLLWEMYLGGSLSLATLLNSMQQFELINIGSVDEEIKKIESETFVPKPKEVSSETIKNTDNNNLNAFDI